MPHSVHIYIKFNRLLQSDANEGMKSNLEYYTSGKTAYLCVGHIMKVLCQKIYKADSCRSKEPCSVNEVQDWTNPFATMRGDNKVVWPFVKLLWTLAVVISVRMNGPKTLSDSQTAEPVNDSQWNYHQWLTASVTVPAIGRACTNSISSSIT